MFDSDVDALFSVAQLTGYAAFVSGVLGFLQRDDRRLKGFVALECATYVLHFVMLGNPTAAASAGVSATRALLSICFRRPWLALLFMTIYVLIGLRLTHSAYGWLPVIGSCFATWGMFLLSGIRMRLTVLVSTVLWLANNVISGSIGGTVLEGFILVTSVTTIVRMMLDSRPPPIERHRAHLTVTRT